MSVCQSVSWLASILKLANSHIFSSEWIIYKGLKSFRKISHQELETSLYLSNFSKKVSQLTDWQTYKKFRIILKWCINIPGMSPKIFRNISHSGPEICLYLSNFSKEVSQLIDWQTYKKFRVIWKWCNNIPGMSLINFRDISHRKLEISLYLFNFSKKVSQLTDWQTYKKLKKKFDLVFKHSRQTSKKFRKLTHPDLKISLY